MARLVEDILRLGDLNWLYWRCDNGWLALWTTERLHKGGDFGVYLLDQEHSVIVRQAFYPRRMDAKKVARFWFLEHSAKCDYVIPEW